MYILVSFVNAVRNDLTNCCRSCVKDYVFMSKDSNSFDSKATNQFCALFFLWNRIWNVDLHYQSINAFSWMNLSVAIHKMKLLFAVTHRLIVPSIGNCVDVVWRCVNGNEKSYNILTTDAGPDKMSERLTRVKLVTIDSTAHRNGITFLAREKATLKNRINLKVVW